MNVIIAYLETMFSAYPQSARLLEAKAELQGMMEDAYSSLIAEGRSENEAVGQVIRDFGNLDEVAPVLGIADLAPADSEAAVPNDGIRGPAAVTHDEARGYADALQRVRFRFTAAIVLFVLSPIGLITLPSAAEAGLLPITEAAGAFIGLLILFVPVVIGVLLLLAVSRETAPYKRISEGRFTADTAVQHWASAVAKEHERDRTRGLQIAVALWILAPIPLIAFALLAEDSPQEGFLTVFGVVLVLVLVAGGLAVLLPRNWAHTLEQELGRGSGLSAVGDDEHGIVGVIAAFYWPLLTAIFLAWSFIGNAWATSWVVWPVGAVLFGAIAAGTGALENYRRARR